MISFDYNGRHYILEYTRDSVKQMEAAGFDPSNIEARPALSLEQMWAGAFIEHHRSVSNTVVKALYDQMKNKTKLFEALKNMMAETYESLLPDEEDDQGNVEWTATP